MKSPTAARAYQPDSVPARFRLIVGLMIGLTFGALTFLWLYASDPRRAGGDFTYVWLAARAMLDGREPYAVVLAKSPFRSPLLYPLPAAVIVMPLAAFSARIAGALFVGTGFGWLAYSLTAKGVARLLVLTAAPALFAVLAVQWSPLLTAAALSGPAIAVAFAKPTIGLALMVMALPAAKRPGRLVVLTVALGAILLLVSLVIRPDWPIHWVAAIRGSGDATQYRAPILTVYGFPACLALLRWRRPEARLVFALACVRQNGFMYDQLPLLLVPATVAQALVLSAISHASHIIALWHAPTGGLLAMNAQQFPFTIAAMYLPCVAMVLTRPNEGPLPAWVDRVTASWPAWIRGIPASQQSRAAGNEHAIE